MVCREACVPISSQERKKHGQAADVDKMGTDLARSNTTGVRAACCERSQHGLLKNHAHRLADH